MIQDLNSFARNLEKLRKASDGYVDGTMKVIEVHEQVTLLSLPPFEKKFPRSKVI